MAKSKSREVLLLYGFRDTEEGRRLKSVAVRMGILCKVLEEDQIDKEIGDILKVPGYRKDLFASFQFGEQVEVACDKDPLTEKAMIMYGFTNSRIDMLLMNLKKAGVPIIRLKAILTPQNISWTFRTLYRELEKEDRAVRGE